MQRGILFPALALTWSDKTLLTPIKQSRAGGRFPKICVFLFFLPHVQRSKAELLKLLRRRDAWRERKICRPAWSGCSTSAHTSSFSHHNNMRNRNARRDNWLLFCIFALISFLLVVFADSENQNQGFDNTPHKLGAYWLYAERKKKRSILHVACEFPPPPPLAWTRVNCLSDRYDANFLCWRNAIWHSTK